MTATTSLTANAAILAAVLLLAACASEPPAPAGNGGGVESGTALPPPDPNAPSRQSDLSGSSVAPVAAPENTGEAAAEGVEPVVIQGPDGTSWTVASPRDEDAYQDDVDDCLRYAVGQTQRDEQYLNDRNAGIDTLSNDSRYSGLVQRVDEFDLRNRRSGLMSSCMESKGYARADTVLPRLEF